MVDFAKCAKSRRKKLRRNETLAAYILEMAGTISFKFGMCTPPPDEHPFNKFG